MHVEDILTEEKNNWVTSPSFSIINSAQKKQYQQNGFLVIKDFVSVEVCDLLIQRANTLIEHFEPITKKSIFSTKNQDTSQLKNQYFLESGHEIRFFFEERALDDEGNLNCEKLKAINKIGHALHDLDPVFNLFSRTYKIASLVNDLGISHPLLLQSMYICKQPHIGGEVSCHQDATYLYTEKNPVTGLWFALEDATLENGCLWAIPGGHKSPLKNRLIRKNQNELCHVMYDETPWALEKLIPLEVSRGSLIVLHGLLPHMSKENNSPHSRHAYSLHIISNEDIYPDDNWLQHSANMPFKGFV